MLKRNLRGGLYVPNPGGYQRELGNRIMWTNGWNQNVANWKEGQWQPYSAPTAGARRR